MLLTPTGIVRPGRLWDFVFTARTGPRDLVRAQVGCAPPLAGGMAGPFYELAGVTTPIDFPATPLASGSRGFSVLVVLAFNRANLSIRSLIASGPVTYNGWRLEPITTASNAFLKATFGGALSTSNITWTSAAGLLTPCAYLLTYDGTTARQYSQLRGRAVQETADTLAYNDTTSSEVLRISSATGALGLYAAAYCHGALSPSVARDIIRDPWPWLLEVERVAMPVAASAGYTHPTLSNARMIWTGQGEGKPAVDYTW